MADESLFVPEMPRDEARLEHWLTLLGDTLAGEDATFNIPIEQSAALAELARTYCDRRAIALGQTTRSPLTIAEKDEARDKAVRFAQNLLRQIRADASVPIESKRLLGLKVGPIKRAPLPAPSTRPILTAGGTTHGMHTLAYADETTPRSKSKPKEAAMLHLHLALTPPGTREPPPPESAWHVGCFTKTPLGVDLEATLAGGWAGERRPTSDYDGMTAFYYGRWGSRKGEFGPWSEPVRMVVMM